MSNCLFSPKINLFLRNHQSFVISRIPYLYELIKERQNNIVCFHGEPNYIRISKKTKERHLWRSFIQLGWQNIVLLELIIIGIIIDNAIDLWISVLIASIIWLGLARHWTFLKYNWLLIRKKCLICSVTWELIRKWA